MSNPTPDMTAAARLLVQWMNNPRMTPEAIGWPLELWMTLCGYSTDSSTEGYEDGMDAAVAYAHELAAPRRPLPAPVPVDVVTATILDEAHAHLGEVVTGAVIDGEVVFD